MKIDLKDLRFNKNGLIPAIVQDYRTNTVLMLAYMNEEALKATIETGMTHFWSRSRNKLWRKGETSGHIQIVKRILYDCDGDTLLVQVEQVGSACHTGNRSCFYRSLHEKESPPSLQEASLAEILNKVYDVIVDRRDRPKESSYVSTLFSSGVDKILSKITEEAGELIISSKNNDREEIIYEAADLWFHTLVLLGYHGLTPQDIYKELERRYGVSGLKKKAREGKESE